MDTTNIARNDASVYIKAPIRPTCLNERLFKAMFAEKPVSKQVYKIFRIVGCNTWYDNKNVIALRYVT